MLAYTHSDLAVYMESETCLGSTSHYSRDNPLSLYSALPSALVAGETQRVVFLSPGVHSFPFKLGLPLGLPSTFLGKHGWVQYFCKTALKEPGGLTHKNQQVFIVMSPIDLNLEPNLLTVKTLRNYSGIHLGLTWNVAFAM